MVPENIHTHPVEGHWKFKGEGVSTAKLYKGKYEAKLELSGDCVGSNEKTFNGEGMDIFWSHLLRLTNSLSPFGTLKISGFFFMFFFSFVDVNFSHFVT